MVWTLTFLTAIAMGGGCVRRRATAGDAPAADLSRMQMLSLLVAGLFLHAAMVLLMRRAGFLMHTFDEPVRFEISWNWARDPFFFTHWDGIWLSGSFIYYGAFMKLLGSASNGLEVALIVGWSFSVLGIAAVARVASARRWVAAAAGLLLAVGHPLVTISHGPMAEVPLIGFLGCAVALSWWLLARPERAFAGRKLLAALGAAVCLAAAASLHYTAWMAIVVLMPFLTWGAWMRRNQLGAADWAGLLLIVAGSAAFPLAWAFMSWRVFGSPTAFLENQVNALEPTQATTGGLLAMYPRLLLRQVWPLLPLMVAALAAAWRGPRRGSLRVLVLYGAGLLALMMLSAVSGGHGATPVRNLIVPYAVLLILVALAAIPLESLLFQSASRGRRTAVAGLLLLFAGWIVGNVVVAREDVAISRWVMEPDEVALAGWLKHELSRPRTLDPALRPRFAVITAEPRTVPAAMLAYLTGMPDAFILTEFEEDGLPLRLPPGVPYLLIDHDHDAVASFDLLARIGSWRVMRNPAL